METPKQDKEKNNEKNTKQEPLSWGRQSRQFLQETMCVTSVDGSIIYDKGRNTHYRQSEKSNAPHYVQTNIWIKRLKV